MFNSRCRANIPMHLALLVNAPSTSWPLILTLPIFPIPYPNSYLYDYHFECLIPLHGFMGTEQSGPRRGGGLSLSRVTSCLYRGNEMQSFLLFFFFFLSCWQYNLFSGKKLVARVSFGTRKWVCGDQGLVEGTPSEQHKGQGCLISRPRLGISGHWSLLGA